MMHGAWSMMHGAWTNRSLIESAMYISDNSRIAPQRAIVVHIVSGVSTASMSSWLTGAFPTGV
jgi:hypothetical protein